MSSSNGQFRYKISYPHDYKTMLARWFQVASQIGIREIVENDALRLDEQLLYYPRSFGDPVHDLQKAKLKAMRARTRYFNMIYAVHFDQAYVFVRSIELRHDTPLGKADAS